MNVEDKAVFEKLPPNKILALCIYGEARGEGQLGKAAVGFVVMNRVNLRDTNVSREVLRSNQFSCFRTDDQNFKTLLLMAKNEYINDKDYKECLYVADLIIDGKIKDFTSGATNYFNPKHANPTWALKMRKLFKLGAHEFYREER